MLMYGKKPEPAHIQGVCTVLGCTELQALKSGNRFSALCRTHKYLLHNSKQVIDVGSGRGGDRSGRRPETTGRYTYRKAKGSYCERCGPEVEYDKCQLDVDHKDDDHSNDDPENLWTLCANCHRLKTYMPEKFELSLCASPASDNVIKSANGACMKKYPYEGKPNAFDYLKELGYEKLTARNGERIVEVDEETWHHFLGCVPPINWHRIGGVEVFCVGECSSGDAGGDIYLQLARMDERYFMRHAYPRNAGSWMNRASIIEALNAEGAHGA